MQQRKSTLLEIAKELLAPPFIITVIALTDAIVFATFVDQIVDQVINCRDMVRHDVKAQLPELAQWCRHTMFGQHWIYRVKEAILHDNVVVNTTVFLTLVYPHSEGGYMLLAKYIFKEKVNQARAEGEAAVESRIQAWYETYKDKMGDTPPPPINGNSQPRQN